MGKVGRDYEVDFIAIKGKRRKYIQVTESLIDPKTRERESRVFKEINDNYSKIIVSLDVINYTSSLFNHFNLFDFLKLLNNEA